MENQIYIDNFTNYLRRKGKAKSTIIAYVKDLKQLSEIYPSKELPKLTEPDIRNALKTWSQNGEYSTKTVSRKLNSIRTFYNFLVEKNTIKESPANSIHHPKFRAEKPRVLSKVEYLSLKDCCSDNLKFYTMIELLLQTGIRIGELSRLKIKDVVINKNPHLIISEFSSIPERKVPLNQKAIKSLKMYLSAYEKRNPDSALFFTKNGKHVQIRNIRAAIDKVIKKAKIKDASVNDLRNTFIVHQLSKGMSLEALAEIVGHKTTVTTMRYIQLLPKQYKDKGIGEVFEV